MKITIEPGAIEELGYGELLDACDVAGVDISSIKQAKGNDQMRLLLAVGWVIARRDDPGLTWDQVKRAQLEVGTATVNPTERPTDEPSPPLPLRRATRRLRSAG